MFSKQTYTYKTAAECDIRADVYRPPDNIVRPAVLWLHGGALMFGDRETIVSEQLSLYINAGYVVIAVDYRLAPEAKLPSIIEDIQDAYQWVRTSGPNLFSIDPDRIAVIGHSAGGYLTLMTGFCVRPRPRALIAFYGYGDIIAPWYSRPDPFYCQFPPVPAAEIDQLVGDTVIAGTPFKGSSGERRSRFYLYCRQNGLWPLAVGGHDPDAEAAWFAPFCPARNVTPDYPPTLLIHGDRDTDVPVGQSVQMSEALQQQGVHHELLILPGQPHGFDHKGQSDPVVKDVFSKVLNFLELKMAL